MGLNQNFKVSKSINIVFAAYIPLSAYLTNHFYSEYSIPFIFAALVAVLIINVINLCTEYFVFSFFRKREINSLVALIVSLGIYIIIQNTISLIWGDSNVNFTMNYGNDSFGIFSGVITLNQILLIAVSIAIFVGIITLKRISLIGKKMDAVSANSMLAEIFGINKSLVLIISSVFTTTSVSIIGVLIALNYGFYPTIGFNFFIYGLIVIIIGGTNKNVGLLFGAIILSASQHLGAFFFDSKWYEIITYLVLILFLIYRPLGFSGNQLKKVEI